MVYCIYACCVFIWFNIIRYSFTRFIDSKLFFVVQVIGRRKVRGQTSMPKIWAQPDGDRVSVSFNGNGQPVDKKTSSKLSHFIRSLVKSEKYCPLHKPWPKVGIAKK